MKPKDRKRLLEEIEALESFISDYPALKALFPDAISQIKDLHKEVLYEKVEDKTGGLDLHAAKIRQIRDFALAAHNLKENFIAILDIKTGGDLWLTTESLEKGDLGSKLTSSLNLFDPLIESVKNVLSSVSGEGITKAELSALIQNALAEQYPLLNKDAIMMTTSLIAIKKLGVDILDQYLDNYKKYKDLNYEDAKPDFTSFSLALNQLFEEEAILTQETFEVEVKTWLSTVDSVLKSIQNDKIAGAGVYVKLVNNLFVQQFAAFPELALKQISKELSSHIAGIKDDVTLTIKDFAEQLKLSLESFKIPTPSIAERAALKKAENIRTQLAKIKVKDAIMGAVNINSPIFVVNQPYFRENLVQELNDWKDSIANSLAEGADLILKLDGCTINGTSFLAGLLDCIKIDAVHKILSGLTFEEMRLRAHKDLSTFEEQWGKPWEKAIASIDVEKHIVDVYKGDAEMLTKLYKDPFSYLPSHDHVIATLNFSIGGKINLALEAVNKLEKKVDKISEEVELIKNVNDIQTLGLGYNSMITEVDIVYKGIIEAHKGYVHRIHLYCLEYGNAYEKADKAITDFNKASDSLKEFREAIFDAMTSVVSTALIATGVGGVGVLVGKMALAIEEEVAKEVVKQGISLTLEATGAKDAIVGDCPQLENTNAKPFMEYLSKQLEGEKEILSALAKIVEISSKIQECNSTIQFVLDNKINVNVELLTSHYNSMTKEVGTWLQKQKAAINAYVQETAKLNPIPNSTRNVLERNMYVNVIGQLGGKVVGDNWQIICDAKKEFRPRLLACNMIRQADFIDNFYYDAGWDDELNYIYGQEEIPLFK
jgi:hypothetical protein